MTYTLIYIATPHHIIFISPTRNLAEFSSMSLGSLENASMEERFLIEFQALSEIHVTGLNSGKKCREDYREI